jgi:predicted nucleic acid-binding Zn ribbon protein
MLPLNQAVPGALAALLRSTPASQGKIQFAWNAVVGATVQRATSVYLDDTLLIVDAASTQWARELTRSAPLIVKRLEALLGPGIVKRLAVRGPTVERTTLPTD